MTVMIRYMAKKILVADDEPHIVKLLKARLEAGGYEVITASDGQECLDKVYRENPVVIILDIMLPKKDGYQVCGILRDDQRYQDIPIIMLTACKEAGEIKKGMESGAVIYLQKPFNQDVLLGMVQELVKDN